MDRVDDTRAHLEESSTATARTAGGAAGTAGAGSTGGAGIGVQARTEAFRIASGRWQPIALLAAVVVQIPPMLWASQDAVIAYNGLRARSGLSTAYVTMALGIIVATQGYRYRTADLTFLVVPHRHRVVVAQALVVGAVGVALSAVLFAGWLAVGVLRHGAAGMRLDQPGRLLVAYAVVALTVAAAAALGVGLGTILRGSSVALLTLIGAGAFELAFDGARFHGPATAVLGVLAWPTSELEGTSLVAAVGWGGLALGGALLAVRRDLAT
ncbi:ABC transporter permease [Frankia sp. Ag45/Mut15]|uniref:ABC transporter permease n=1 Tax=Frankia umida TaxID=573489 RepID=A0ABT0JU59_9ACTN|nr:ABC transporter permease [Frankia umida]MCK9875083.1 ABC transporter permease [Frankia umida]